MSTTHRRCATRLAMSLLIAAGTLAGGAIVSTPSALASPGSAHQDRLNGRLAKSGGAKTLTMAAAVAPTCLDASNLPVECPTVASVTVGTAWIRTSTTIPITYPVTVVVHDPANIAVDMDMAMGRGLDTASPTVVVGDGWASSAPIVNSTLKTKTFTGTMSSPYLPLYPKGAAPAYGAFQINPVVWGVDPADPPGALPSQFLTEAYRSGSIKARSVITNTPSATTVRYAQSFIVRGRLSRFDGTPQAGQKVNVYYVPAGQTRTSYAGTATTSSTGAFALTARCWGTGSWFVNYPGSALSTGVYKSVWIRVS